MGRTKGAKNKIKLLSPQEVLRFPQGDPRNAMTDEEIRNYALMEEQEIDMRIGRFIQAIPADLPIEEESEEEEIFTVDPDQKVITQSTVFLGDLPRGGIVSEGLTAMLTPPQPRPMLAEHNPYTVIITDVLVRKAINSIIRKYRDFADELDDFSYKAPTNESRDAIRQEQTNVEKKISELRASITSINETGAVSYDKIPEWASSEIRFLVYEAFSELIGLTFLDKGRG